MILITGATGTIGNEVSQLLARQGANVRAMTRDPSRARMPAGIDVVPGDFEHPDSLRHAVEGASAVFLLTAPGAWIPEHDRAMLHAARVAGVQKVVKLSAIGTGTTNDSTDRRPGNWHLPGEQALQESDMAWTLLRPSSFASNALRWADAIRNGKPVPNMTGTGTQGVVDPRDVAAAAAEALISDKHNGQIYTLTGPDLLSVPDQVAQLADELGHPIETVDVPLDVARQQMLAAGVDSSVVEVAIIGAELTRAGGNATLTNDVERALARPAHTFQSWVRAHRDAFARSRTADSSGRLPD